MDLTLYNTLHHKKEEFVPMEEGKAGLYSCGPTVYSYQHLGNMRAFVMWDFLRRILEYNGFEVNHVINITDVGHLTDDADQGEDKMEQGARREGKTVWELAEYYTKVFKQDLASLNVLAPTTWCVATEHIKEQIDMIKRIEEQGFAYQTSDGIYFDTSKLDDYGKLVKNFDPEKLDVGSRVEFGEKKHPTDFALWKFSPEDEQRQMEWMSPWGKGFPGWHIECTAMGCKYLGKTFDIHTGGIEHIPVHHTNEIAQAQAAFGDDHVRYWLHNEWLLLGKDKFSKSLGHTLRVQDIVEKDFDPLDYRYFLALTNYRKPAKFSLEALESARTARRRLTERVIELKESVGVPAAAPSEQGLAFQRRFVGAINDDLNVPEALALAHELLKSDVGDAEKLSLLIDWDRVFGFRLKQVRAEEIVVPDDVQSLVDEREAARKAKDFEKSDRLRDELSQRGWSVSDTPEGPVVKPE